MTGARARVGISGWTYAPWRSTFYPKGLAHKNELRYAAERMDSIELNGSFYALQKPASYRRWAEETPEDFVFSIKGGRYVTHIRRLQNPTEALSSFFASGLLTLGDKLGPLLWQLPPNLPFDRALVDSFFAALPRTAMEAAALGRTSTLDEGRTWTAVTTDRPLRHTIEVRNESFVDDAFTELARSYGIAIVVADTAGRWPLLREVTTDFMYLRLHGDEELYTSGYTPAALDAWAHDIRGWVDGSACPDGVGRDVYVYFDNDTKVRAPVDAMALRERLAGA
ncbi:DUF72 domain-containing protein [Diaminobutyricibacter tongyongensis]|uniref:DUF72 domain-containing protein n=1 Tax=Leifsonia tongyongensis TaxID=1268043 RepID=A0A6L9XXB3_9MICO|nr:DUF72 domain-containing protein [Diaminobutyricibacter tongyongensis]